MGEFAAVCTSLCWTLTSIFFSNAARKVGSMVVNRARLAIAFVLLSLIHWALMGQIFPANAGLEQYLWLGISGIIGLTIGDLFLFQCYVLIGTRLGTVLMAVAPVLSAIIAWLFLGEVLTPIEMVGILVTVSGILWVVLERKEGNGQTTSDRKRLITGILCGLGGALCQALGLVFSKKGMMGGLSPLSGQLIRVLCAGIVIWVITFFMREAKSTVESIREQKALGWITLGSIFGPCLGVWLSLVSVQLIPVGISSTLTSLMPVFMLPISGLVFKEKISPRAIFGTLGAFAGIAMIFLIS